MTGCQTCGLPILRQIGKAPSDDAVDGRGGASTRRCGNRLAVDHHCKGLADARIGQRPFHADRPIAVNPANGIEPEEAVQPRCPGKLEVPGRAAQQNALSLRSEEHTSELQSLMRNTYAVFCLKKKNK